MIETALLKFFLAATALAWALLEPRSWLVALVLALAWAWWGSRSWLAALVLVLAWAWEPRSWLAALLGPKALAGAVPPAPPSISPVSCLVWLRISFPSSKLLINVLHKTFSYKHVRIFVFSCLVTLL